MVTIFSNAPWQLALGSLQEVTPFLATGSVTFADHLQTMSHPTGSIVLIYRK